MIRVVLDTNIIVSAFFWGGTPRAALDAARAKRVQIITTEALIAELKEVISRSKFADRLSQIGETAETLLDNDYRALVEIVEAAEIEPIIVDDPDDDILIACAMGGKADYIISGDRHLLALKTHENIMICSVNHFIKEILKID